MSAASGALETLVERLLERVDRLEHDAAGRREIAELAQRLDQALARLTDQLGHMAGAAGATREAVDAANGHLMARLDGDFGNLAQFIGRLDRDLASGLSQAAERVDALSVSLRQVETGATRGQGQIVARLDNELGSLAALATRLDQDLMQVSAHVQTLRETARLGHDMMAKVLLNQSDFAETLREFRHGAPGRGRSADPAESRPQPRQFPPFDPAMLPRAVRQAIADRAWLDDDACRLPILSGMTADDLPDLIGMLAGAHSGAAESRRALWVQPPDLAQLLTPAEAVQLFGLLGPVERHCMIGAEDGDWRLLSGRTRAEAYALCLRWSESALEALHFRQKPVYAAALDRWAATGLFHAIDIPQDPAKLNEWKVAVGDLIPMIAGRDGTVFGIVLPADFADHPAAADEAVRWLRGYFPIDFQWVRGRMPLAASGRVIEFAGTHGISLDCTPVPRGSSAGSVEAYEEFAPYRPLRFDLRLPCSGAAGHGVLVMPRRSGREFVLARMAAGAGEPRLGAVLDRAFDQSCRRLMPVLDRAGRAQFEAQVNLDNSLVPLWPDYFVYNWSVPPAARLCLFEFDAAELIATSSPLARVQREQPARPDPRHVDAARFVELVRRIVESGESDAELRARQVEEHLYLRDQPGVTADTARLIGWMPAGLGATLELGSGFGAMTSQVCRRAASYVGLDLTADQARSLAGRGAAGVVGDMQTLPFADACFDTIIADNVVEHGRDPLAVLAEARRVLREGGDAFLLIPYDYASADFRNTAHFWKADEASIRLAVGAAGFTIARHETIDLGALGVTGAFPSSKGSTGLWHLRKAAPG